MKIARVFPSRTHATPIDPLAFVGNPPAGVEADRVLISCSFSWDRREAERLAKAWGHVAPVDVGGPAFGDRGGDFEPGKFLRPGYVITSRGCPNRCWFCDVHRREGPTRELPVRDGWNVLDSNLLACSAPHVDSVLAMLEKQSRRPVFSGGLEAKRITPETARKLRQIKTERIYCAYDTPDDLEPLVEAGRLLQQAGFSRKHHLFAYVLCGFKGDTVVAAEQRMLATWRAGFHPFAMAWKDPGESDWQRFSRVWARPAITRVMLSELIAEIEGEKS